MCQHFNLFLLRNININMLQIQNSKKMQVYYVPIEFVICLCVCFSRRMPEKYRRADVTYHRTYYIRYELCF
jgi:hypothetical protein